MRKAFADKYPQIVTAFLKTFQTKIDQYQKDPEGSAQIIAKNLDQPIESVRRTLAGLSYPTIEQQLSPDNLGTGQATRGSGIDRAMIDTAKFLASSGQLRADAIPASYANNIDSSFLARAAGH